MEQKKRLFYLAVKRLLKEKMKPGEKPDRVLSVEEAIALAMIKKAMGGDMTALKWLSELMDGEEGPEGAESVRIEVIGRDV